MKRIWIFAGVVGLGIHLGNGTFHSFERRAAEDIKSKLSGPAIVVKVSAKPAGLLGPLFGEFDSATIQASNFFTRELPLFTEPWRNHSGRVSELKLDLSDFKLGDLDIKRLSANIPNCRFDLPLAMKSKQIRLSQSGTGDGLVEIEEGALERFILAKFKEIKTVSVKCDRGWIWVEGFGEFLIIETQFRVLAKLQPVGGSKLVLTRARIAFDGLPADSAVADALLQTLNPIVDLDADLRLHGAISIGDIKTEDGMLTATGKTTIPIQPK